MRDLGPAEREELIEKLAARFGENLHRHADVKWSKVRSKLEAQPEKLWTLGEMERTGGEPDVVGHGRTSDEFLFYDCAKETPTDRRSLCYDAEALASRKKNKPRGSAAQMAADMGAELLDEEEYRRLQALGDVDTKTSSWLKTPQHIRKLGGAIFGDFRFGTVFVYHNGAESYYGARGFRCRVCV